MTRGASSGKIRFETLPSSSTTSGRTVIRGSPAGASSGWRRSVGRTPRMTARRAPASGEPSGSGTPSPAKLIWPSPTSASTTFIDGEPMNAATKRLAGSWKSLCGVSHCCRTPSRSTATRWPERHRLDLVVGDVDGRHAEPLVQPRQLAAHRDAQLGVEVRERLVHEERLRLAHHRAAHRDALPLAAREQGRPAVEQRLRARASPRPRRTRLARSGFGHAAQLEPEAEVLVHAHVRVERVVLEHHRDVAVARPQLRSRPRSPIRMRPSVTSSRPGDHPQQRRLAAARRADEHHELAVADVEVDRVDRLDAVRIDLRRPLEPDPARQAGLLRSSRARRAARVQVGLRADAVGREQQAPDDRLDVGVDAAPLPGSASGSTSRSSGEGWRRTPPQRTSGNGAPSCPVRSARDARVVADRGRRRLRRCRARRCRPLPPRRAPRRRSAPARTPPEAVVDPREGVEQVLRARAVPALERAGEQRGRRAEAEHVPPDRGERLRAERVRARRVGPEAEVEDLAGGVPRRRPRSTCRSRPRRRPRRRSRSGARPIRVVDDLRLVARAEPPRRARRGGARSPPASRRPARLNAAAARSDARRARGVERRARTPARSRRAPAPGPRVVDVRRSRASPRPSTVAVAVGDEGDASSCCRRRRRGGARTPSGRLQPLGQVVAVRGRERVVDALGELELAHERVRARARGSRRRASRSRPSRRRAPGTRRASRRARARAAAAASPAAPRSRRAWQRPSTSTTRSSGKPGSAPPAFGMLTGWISSLSLKIASITSIASSSSWMPPRERRRVELRVVGLRLLLVVAPVVGRPARGCPPRASSAWRGARPAPRR